MIERIEEYKQINGVDILKVILRPTAKFPNGSYFYTPAEALSLVQNYNWFLHQAGNKVQVIAKVGSGCVKNICFHKELFKFYQGYNWQGLLDHIDSVEFDNVDQNLNAISSSQSNYNKFVKGYFYHNRDKCFQPRIVIDSRHYYPFSAVHREDDACILQNNEQIYLRDKLGTDYYMFDFKKYRRGSEDILDLERTGKISEEVATYMHILKYADNAWYYLRYDLREYFQEYHIPVPKYSLDTNGFMVHPITGQKLCPF